MSLFIHPTTSVFLDHHPQWENVSDIPCDEAVREAASLIADGHSKVASDRWGSVKRLQRNSVGERCVEGSQVLGQAVALLPSPCFSEVPEVPEASMPYFLCFPM